MSYSEVAGQYDSCSSGLRPAASSREDDPSVSSEDQQCQRKQTRRRVSRNAQKARTFTHHRRITTYCFLIVLLNLTLHQFYLSFNFVIFLDGRFIGFHTRGNSILKWIPLFLLAASPMHLERKRHLWKHVIGPCLGTFSFMLQLIKQVQTNVLQIRNWRWPEA